MVRRGSHRDIMQVATDEERVLRERAGGVVPEPRNVGSMPPSKPSRPTAPGFAGGPAYNALAEGMHKKSVAWALKLIERLDTEEEIQRLRRFELENPRYAGGRTGILTALDAKEADLAPKEFVPPEKIALDDGDDEI